MPVNQGTDFENLPGSRNQKGGNTASGTIKEGAPGASAFGQDIPASSGAEAQMNSSELGQSKQQFEEEEPEEEAMVETNISKLLSERTTKVVIIIVLIMLFFQPVFSSDTYIDEPGESDQALAFLVNVYDRNQSWSLYQSAASKLIS